jgi:molybdopterin synthase catalytic subunit
VNQISVKVSDAPISIDSCLGEGNTSAQGAQVIFTGVVREQNLGKRVTGMSYDSFEPLAQTVLQEIGQEAAEKWGPSMSILIQHRTGRLKIGETSVLIITRSPHRAEAYEASRYVIDQLKTRAPIWKQEHYQEGNSEWLRGHALCQSSAH